MSSTRLRKPMVLFFVTQVRAHVATHVLQDGNVHRCLLCGSDTTFDSPARLQAHLVADHEPVGVSETVCDVCGTAMSGPVAARQHSLEHGPSAWKHACSQCPLRFFFAAELRNHELVDHDLTSPGPSPSLQRTPTTFDGLVRCNVP